VEKALQIIHAIEETGYSTYVVGGAVRDRLLGLAQKDVDVVTLAPPEVVEEAAERRGWPTKTVGSAFGVTIVVVGGKAYEVATARDERYGEDCHRPEYVEYVSDIKTDLARRDFTVNAMAMDSRGTIIDPYGGREDLNRSMIRAVGCPEQRFAEDGLRSFRAIRLAAQYGFTIEEKTFAAIPYSLQRVSGLSIERVSNEIEKILTAHHAAYGLRLLVASGLAQTQCTTREKGKEKLVDVLPEITHLIDLPQSPKFHSLDVWNHTLEVVEAVPQKRVLRWAALLHDIAKGLPGIRNLSKRGHLADPGHDKKGADMADRILTRLKVPPHTVKKVVWMVYNHMTLPHPERNTVIKWLRKQSRQFKSQEELSLAVGQLLVLARADVKGGMVEPDFSHLNALEEMVNKILATGPFYVAELAISGKDVAAELGSGPQVGKFMTDALVRIQSGALDNEKNALFAALAKRKVRMKKGR